jgi:hypothetical protein
LVSQAGEWMLILINLSSIFSGQHSAVDFRQEQGYPKVPWWHLRLGEDHRVRGLNVACC